MANQYTESLFQSIDTIVSKKIENLPYDRTILCTVLSGKAEDGIYTVQYQSASFTAYSNANAILNKGDQVYVCIPQSDFNQNKYIISKVIEKETQKVLVSPFGNYYPLNDDNYKIKEEKETKCDLSKDEIVLFQGKFDKDILPLTRMGLQFYLNTKNINKNCNYYFKLTLTGSDLSKVKKYVESDVVFTYTKDDMFISEDYIKTNGFSVQQKVFDISDCNFKDYKFSLIIDKKSLSEDDKEDFLKEASMSIKKFTLTFGLDLSNFYEDNAYILYTQDGHIYSSLSNSSKILYKTYKKIDNHICEEFVDSDTDKLILTEVKQSDLTEPEPVYINNWIDNSVNFENSKSIKGYIYYITREQNVVSNNLNYINSAYVQNAELLDLVSGFTVSVNDSDNGQYYIYGQDGKLLNEGNAYTPHKLIFNYHSESNDRVLQNGDIISVAIPIENTMITGIDCPDKEQKGPEYTYQIGKEVQLEKDNTVCINFYISNYYYQTYTNNLFECTLTLGNGQGSIYTTEKELTFGTSGSQGTDYILLLKLIDLNGKQVQAITKGEEKLKVEVQLLDYNNTEIAFENYKSTIQYNWAYENNYFNFDKVNYEISFGEDEINFNPYDSTFCESNILIAELEYDGRFLTGYLPISIRSDKNYTLDGTPTITYDVTGKKPVYYKSEYKLYLNNQEIEDEGREIVIRCSDSADQDIIKINNYTINPIDIYKKQNGPITLFIGENWIMPILILQNKYPSAMQSDSANKYVFDITDIININQNNYSGNENYIVNSAILGSINSNKKAGLVAGEFQIENDEVTEPFTAIISYGPSDNEESVLSFYADNNGYVGMDGGENGLVKLYRTDIDNSQLKNCEIDNYKFKIDSSIGDDTHPIYLDRTTGQFQEISYYDGVSSYARDYEQGYPIDLELQELKKEISALNQIIDLLTDGMGGKSIKKYIDDQSYAKRHVTYTNSSFASAPGELRIG